MSVIEGSGNAAQKSVAKGCDESDNERSYTLLS